MVPLRSETAQEQQATHYAPTPSSWHLVNFTRKLNQKLCVWNNTAQRLSRAQTNLHATTSFNNLFQFAHSPRRDSSKPAFRQNNCASEDSQSIPHRHQRHQHHHLPSGLITALPHCDAVTFTSDINIYVVKFSSYRFMSTPRPWNLPALVLRCKSFTVALKKQRDYCVRPLCCTT